MNLQFIFNVEQEPVESDVFYNRLGRLLDAIKPSLPDVSWYVTPENAKDSAGPGVPFTDKLAFMARVEKQHEAAVREWAAYPFKLSVLLTHASDEKAFKAIPGRCSLSFSPGHGCIKLKVSKPGIAWPQLDLLVWARGLLRAVVLEEWVLFASVDVSEPKKEGRGRSYYQIDHRTFPHRQFLGWMGWVQRLPPAKPITAEDLPQAAEVIPMSSRCGSLIVAVGETFDLHNPYHIMQAQKVEMRLVDLDALPVIDPAFM